MASQLPIFNLRIPPDLKSQLEVRAKSMGRSITAEIIKLIEDGINNDSSNVPVEFEKRLASLKEEHEVFKKELVRRDEMDVFVKQTLEKIKKIESLMDK